MNEHIKKSCYEYIEMGLNPEYGMLINGPWGCGKTHLINEMIEKLPDSVDKKDIINISMYGITTIRDIEEKIFEKTNKILSNEKVKTVTELIGRVSFAGVSLDAKLVTQLFIRDWFNKKRVVIVDDIERSKLSITEIFGYFYNLIIDKDARVIFVGHDDKIEDNEYKLTKEKVIGKTLTIEPDVESAVNAFIEYDLKLGVSKDRAKDIIKQVMSNLEFSNLRAVRLGLLNLNMLMEEVSQYRNKLMDFKDIDYESDEYTVNQYFEDIFKYYLVLFLQYSQGVIERDIGEDTKILAVKDLDIKKVTAIVSDVIGLYSNYEQGIIQYYEDMQRTENPSTCQKKDIMADLTESLKFITRRFVPLTTSEERGYAIWEKYLLESKIDSHLIKEAVKNDVIHFTPKVKEEKSHLLKMLEGMFDMSKNDFVECYKGMIEELLNGEYTEAGEILHGFSLCVYLEEQRVISNDNETLEELFDRILENTSIRNEEGYYGWRLLDRSSLGYQYIGVQDDERWKTFVGKVSTFMKESSSTEVRDEFIEQFKCIETDDKWQEWVNEIYNIYGNTHRRYRELPILSLLDAQELFDKLIIFGVGKQRSLFTALKERYGMKYSSGRFEEKDFPDFENLLKLKELYEQHLVTLGVGDNSIMKIKMVLEDINGLVDYCRNFISIDEKE